MPTAIIRPESGARTTKWEQIYLDGSASINTGSPTYVWEVIGTPIGSELTDDHISYPVDGDAAKIFVVPDKIGRYTFRLTVSDAEGDDSTESYVDVHPSQALYNTDLAPTGEFLWQTISDFWKLVDGKEKVQIFWSAALQACSGLLLDMYQSAYDRSIIDIQDNYGIRWRSYRMWYDFVPDEYTDGYLEFIPRTGVGTGTQPWVEGDIAILSPTKVMFPLSILGVYSLSNAGSVLEITGIGAYNIVSRDLLRGTVTVNNDPANLIPVPPIVGQATNEASCSSGSTTISIPSGVPAAVQAGGGYLIRIISQTVNGLFVIQSAMTHSVTVTTIPGMFVNASWQIYEAEHATVELSSDPLTNTFSTIGNYSGNEKPKVIVANGKLYQVINTLYISDLDISYIQVDVSDLPVGEEIAWEIPSYLTAALTNFEDLGVSATDMFDLELISQIGRDVIPCQVLASRDRMVCFRMADVDWETLYGLTAQVVLGGGTPESVDAAYLKERLEDQCRFAVEFGEPLVLYGRSIIPRPQRIKRHLRMPVDVGITSIPWLVEYIKQPLYEDNGNGTYTIRDYYDTLAETKPWAPLQLIEGTDFYIDPGEFAGNDAYSTLGDPYIDAVSGFFQTRDIRLGDTIEVLDTTYTIIEVVSESRVKVDPAPVREFARDRYYLKRADGGMFIRFAPAAVSSAYPEYLFADITYVSNISTIEENYGVFSGYTEFVHDQIGLGNSYRDVVAGILFGMYSSPSTYDLAEVISAVAALPVVHHLGLILEIENAYLLHPDTGAPLLGRVLVKDLSTDYVPMDNIRAYYFPPKLDDDPVGITGIRNHPVLDRELQVGDIVRPFWMLSNGADVLDYINAPDRWAAIPHSNIWKYHHYIAQLNVDVVNSTSVDDILGYLSGLLRDIDQARVKCYLDALKYVHDYVDVDDSITFDATAGPIDHPGGTEEAAVVFDSVGRLGYSSIAADRGFVSTRSLVTGTDLTIVDAAVATVDTHIDFLTNPGGPAAGVITDAPWVRVGDVLRILDLPNRGWYSIDAINGTELDITPLGDATLPLQDAQSRFTIHRVLGNPVYWAWTLPITTAAYAGGVTTIVVDDTLSDIALFSDGVSPGDVLILEAVGAFVIQGVYSSDPAWPASGKMNVLEVLGDASAAAGTNTVGFIQRPAWMSKEFYLLQAFPTHVTAVTNPVDPLSFDVVSVDIPAAIYPLVTPGMAVRLWVETTGDPALDVSYTFRITDTIAPEHTRLSQPVPADVLAALGGTPVRMDVILDRGAAPPSHFDYARDFIPWSAISVVVESDGPPTLVAAPMSQLDPVTVDDVISVPAADFTEFVRPGDLLHISDAVPFDFGYGDNVVPIQEVLGPQQLKLARAVVFAAPSSTYTITLMRRT